MCLSIAPVILGVLLFVIGFETVDKLIIHPKVSSEVKVPEKVLPSLEDSFKNYKFIECNKYDNIATCQYNDGEKRYFKIINGERTRYYFVTKKFLGEGAFGKVYIGEDLENGPDIAIKHAIVQKDEVRCLQMVNMYIGHNDRYILMRKARGKSLESIIRDKIYSPEKLIKIHKAIQKEFDRLKGLKIAQRDAYTRHIFVSQTQDFRPDEPDEFIIDIIDYGRCIVGLPNHDDMCHLNNHMIEADDYRGDHQLPTAYKKYIKTQKICE